MITYTDTISTFDELYDTSWSGAIPRLDEISELGLEDEFMEYLAEMLSYNIEITRTTINDFIWFECDEWIEQHKESDDDDDVL